MSRRGSIFSYCNGRIFLGPDWRFSLLLPGLTGIGTLLFSAYTCDVMLWIIIVVLLYLLTVAVYGLAAFRDPGIVDSSAPLDQQSSRPPSRWVRLQNATNSATFTSLPKVVLDGPSPPPSSFTDGYHIVEQRFCYTCHLYRPIRSVHCRFCDVCLYRRDHHCPWLGTCVAEKNYGFFYGMLWSIVTLETTTGILSAIHLSRRATEVHRCCTCLKEPCGSDSTLNSNSSSCHCEISPTLVAVSATYGMELFLTFICLAVSLCLLMAIVSHTKQICRNELLGDESRFGGINIFDKGNLWSNVKASLCFSSPEALICHEVYQPFINDGEHAQKKQYAKEEEREVSTHSSQDVNEREKGGRKSPLASDSLVVEPVQVIVVPADS